MILRNGTLRAVALAGALGAAACGSTPEERGLSGMGVGAAGGAVLGAITGLSVVEGVLIGAAAGGLTGVLTDREQLNLGEPIWKRGAQSGRSSSGQASKRSGGGSAVTRDVQAELASLGYDPGPVDGVMGPRTAAAIRRYQAQHGLPADGRPSAWLAQHIREQGGADEQVAGGR